MTEYNFTFQEEHLQPLLNALDFYSRLNMGQFTLPFENCFLQNKNLTREQRDNYFKNQEIIEQKLLEIRNFIFPELNQEGNNSSHGIGNKMINPEAAECFDMLQVIRHTRYSNHHSIDGTVDSKEPLRFGKIGLIHETNANLEL
jgi:hypothetical protein